MSKKKYNLSDEGVDKLMKRLSEISDNELTYLDSVGYIDGKITTDYIKKTLNVVSEEDALIRNEELTDKHRGFIEMYGFETLYDLYVYALSSDNTQQSIKKNKDYSKLVPVKRKVKRGGKEHEITVWVKPDEDEETEDGEATEQGNERGRRGDKKGKNARDLKNEIIEGDLKEVAKLKQALDSLPKGDKEFKEDSRYYLEIREEEEIVGVVGYSIEDEFIKMDFYRSNGEVAGVASRGFLKLLELAYEEGKGAKVDDDENAQHIFNKSGLTQQENGEWSIDKEELEDVFTIDIEGTGKDG